MKKLIMWNVMTLDGYFEGTNKWDLEFHNLVWGPELEKLSIEQLDQAEYLVFGRVTWEGMRDYWMKEKGEIADRMNRIKKLVFSTTLESADWNSTLIKANASEELSKIKAQASGDLFLFGSADLSQTFIEDQLIDEYRIGIAPIILGAGNPLFKSGTKPQNVILKSTLPLTGGGVVLFFERPAK
jgi:dihydrofolate reductase